MVVSFAACTRAPLENSKGSGGVPSEPGGSVGGTAGGSTTTASGGTLSNGGATSTIGGTLSNGGATNGSTQATVPVLQGGRAEGQPDRDEN